MWECDWTQIDVFKQRILSLKSKYTFISLAKVERRLVQDKVRLKNYAALTADDGWESLNSILPWLYEQQIPITLFLNPLYLDGVHKQIRKTERLLTYDEIEHIVSHFAPYVTIASHGWSHKDCLKMTDDEFQNNVKKAETFLKGMDGYIPFYAFTFGRYKTRHLDYLNKNKLIPVLMDGGKNYHKGAISRECIDEGLIPISDLSNK